ncbi:MAG: DUF1302 family protein [Rhodothermales bacterium]
MRLLHGRRFVLSSPGWFVLLLMMWAGSLDVRAQDGLQFSGFLRFYAGVETDAEAAFIAARSRARLNLLYRYDRGRIFLSNDLRNDYLRTSDDAPIGEVRYDLREAFIDVYGPNVDVRLGRQQIVWGEADGAFVTDLVAPLDLTEFLAQDFADIRLGIPALKVIYYPGAFALEGVLIPRYFPSRLPEAGSPWDPLPERLAGLPVVRREGTLPAFTLRNGETALRLTYNGLPWTSVALLHLYTWNRQPAFDKGVTLASGRLANLTFTPAYYRRHVAGLTFSTALPDPFVVRGEVAVYSRRAFDLTADASLLTAPLDPSRLGLLQAALEDGFLAYRPFGQAMLGMERLWGRHLVRVQGISSLVFRYDDALAQRPFEQTVTVLYNGSFRRETLALQAFGFYNLAGRNYWFNPALTYAVRDALNATLGLHLFGGDAPEDALGTLPTTFSFATYRANDFVYLKVQYDF